MNRRDKGTYGFEIRFQCRVAIVSWNAAHKFLTVESEPDFPTKLDLMLRAFSEIQGFLVAAAVLSDIFFPAEPSAQDRGAELRLEYAVERNSPLAGKKVRNSFVHLADRVDKFLAAHPDPTEKLGPFTITAFDGPPPLPSETKIQRILDNKNWRVLIHGDELQLLPLLEEIERIGKLTDTYDKVGVSPT